MRSAGIEDLNVFGGTACIDVSGLAAHRKLHISRFNNLMMEQKAVALPCEDPITFAVNAAAPIVEALSPADKGKIELLITCSESGIDFGKSISTYVHDYLGLHRNCRLFEVKQACYAATAGLQMAASFVLSQTSPSAKALVIATDISRFLYAGGSSPESQDWSYAELSGGAGAVAMLVSATPGVFALDIGANGYYGYEVMDTCRPIPDSEAGDTDRSLLAYLDCCEHAFTEYTKRVEGVDFATTFDYLAFHVPFGGMVKGAHRSMMRKLRNSAKPDIETDFDLRVKPGLLFCQQVGNIMGGTVFLSLASIIANGSLGSGKRVGCFSYGSGCCSEFFSGIARLPAPSRGHRIPIQTALDARARLSVGDYEDILRRSEIVKFGVRDTQVERDAALSPSVAAQTGARLALSSISNFHRRYEWLS